MNKFLVEFLGTLFFLYVIISTGNAIAAGSASAIAIMVGAPISGGYFNPAVSVMMSAAGKLPFKDLVPYIIAELAGGLVAYELNKHVKL
jgi:glycerol uptake facilitator-like aquaporin